MTATAKEYGVAISGGDIASLPAGCPAECLVATLTITGKVRPELLCLRKNAHVGEKIFVTGLFGNSFASHHHLTFTPRLAEAAVLAGRFTQCMIDVSDGLLLDLGRIAQASGVGMILDTAKIPQRGGADLTAALGDGEDYELIFTVDAAAVETMLREWRLPCPLTEIGVVTASHSGLVFDRNGVNLSATHQSGFKHLSIK